MQTTKPEAHHRRVASYETCFETNPLSAACCHFRKLRGLEQHDVYPYLFRVLDIQRVVYHPKSLVPAMMLCNKKKKRSKKIVGRDS